MPKDDFISLTDIARYKNADYPSEIIQNWMRNRSTVEFLGLWERLYNADFNYLEFEVIDKEAGRNAFVLTPKRWIETVIGETASEWRAKNPGKKGNMRDYASVEQLLVLANLEFTMRFCWNRNYRRRNVSCC